MAEEPKRRGRPRKNQQPEQQTAPKPQRQPSQPYSIVQIGAEYWTYRSGMKLNKFNSYEEALATC